MNRILTLATLLPLLAYAAAAKPNILFILADDLGWGDVGYHGSQIRTPTIDRLASEGMELDAHYVYPQCTPTRIGLMTGRYATRYGIPRPVNMQVLPFGTDTMASVLQSCGYETAVIGKWHLGSDPRWVPNEYGFDYSYGSLAGEVHPWRHEFKHPKFSKTWHRNGVLIEESPEVTHTELTVRESLKWLENRSGEQPWFLYLAFHAVHTPVDAMPEFKKMYSDHQYYDDPKKQDSFVRFAAMATEMDAGIARVLDFLSSSGQLENTLIVFTSDNGGIVLEDGRTLGGTYEDSPELASHVLSSNGQLRGQKATVFEGGIRVPTAVYWEGTLSPRKLSEPLIVTDWLPTFAALAGYQPPPLHDPKWDGTNIMPLLTGEVRTLAPRPLYIRYIHNMIALRYGDWKLVKMSDTRFAKRFMPSEDRSDRLYHVAQDPFEEEDLAAEFPDIVRKLNQLVEEEMRIDMPMRDAYEAFPTLNYDIY